METLVYDLLIILAAGLLSGIISKRLGTSMLVGYLLAGAVIGPGVLGLVDGDGHEIEQLAHVGALLLLFAIGIEFSLEELVRLGRYILVGGSVQMFLVAAPVAIVCRLLGVAWGPAIAIAAAVALSSTVLVFRALSEWGESSTPRGRRAIGVLLFQDAALVPLMLLLPLLVGDEDRAGAWEYVRLALNSTLFVAAVIILRDVFTRWVAPLLSRLRSVELVVLFGLVVLAGFCQGAVEAGLPPALGAFAAGLALSGNRLTGQVDALILPYRESFGAVFFVSLGLLLDPGLLKEEPLLLVGSLLGVLALKSAAAAIALRTAGLAWRPSAGMGLGLAQMGELSFVLLSAGLHEGVFDELVYNRMLFVAIGTLILTPQLIKWGLRLSRQSAGDHEAEEHPAHPSAVPREAIVIGLGPIGRQAASQLEILGVDVCLIDTSPVNLHAHAQQGFRTISGDGSDPEVLARADAADCRLAVVCVPDDRTALQIVRTLRGLNPTCDTVVRCRYESNRSALTKAGASGVISEEAEASVALRRLLQGMDRDG